MNKIVRLVLVGIIVLGFMCIFYQFLYEERNPIPLPSGEKSRFNEGDSGLIYQTLSDESDRYQEIELIEVTMTAYSPSPHITNSEPFTMASEKKATPQDLWELRYVALSRDLMEKYGIEYGDVVYLPFEVQDTMNIRIENTVDLFMRNLELARRFGRQTRKIIILEEE